MRILAALASLSLALAQPPPGVKPLRERLLERAQKGDAEAQFELGKNYETGRIGLPLDFAQAEHWYREAANRGDAYGQLSLAILYNFGRGVERNYTTAYMWYELAAAHTSGGDRESVADLRDNMARHMTAAQIEEGKRRAREWKPAH